MSITKLADTKCLRQHWRPHFGPRGQTRHETLMTCSGGPGANATSRCMNLIGLMTRCEVPSRHQVLSFCCRCPAVRTVSRRRTGLNRPLYRLLPVSAYYCGATFGGGGKNTTGRFGAMSSAQRMLLMGRPLPTADVGYPVAQLGGQLSGSELARPTGAGRPVAGACACGSTRPEPNVGRHDQSESRARTELMHRIPVSFSP